ncbi:hypothetical protein DFA_06889 [Cavenderia fasciculata]|uniref:MORN repeat-containing protein n=1 Tax=Cavenderia fasciculata TaxID=261658 RepID=F4PWY5_CACFS|nr:uncharacterized protein DFA_06889 [Cavenderia fasciculata]EGG19788.1 hypothetical protein DFA_06889 [Cavenderia fasciculata]|eukprot:XP_004358134.1 hypothetical protein DFA_06889 [Cavenderia fasciculata]
MMQMMFSRSTCVAAATNTVARQVYRRASSSLSLPLIGGSLSSSSSSSSSSPFYYSTFQNNNRIINNNVNNNNNTIRYYSTTGTTSEDIKEAEIIYKYRVEKSDKRFNITTLEEFRGLKPSDRLVELYKIKIPSVEKMRDDILSTYQAEKEARNQAFLEHLPHLKDMFKLAQQTSEQFKQLSQDIASSRGIPSEKQEEEKEKEKETNDSGRAEYVEITGKHGEVTSKRGTKYKGGLSDTGVPQGPGEYETASGEVYVGEFVDGKRHGAGRFIWADGSSYDGFWANDQMEGLGVYQRRDGLSHDGEWKNGKRHGYGVHLTKELEIRGEWVNDNLVRGHEVRKDVQLEYNGEFLGDDWHGKGRVAYTDGTIFEGVHKNGLRHGPGRLVSTKQVFECTWVDGVPTGNGRWFSNDMLVEGHWEDGDCVKGFVVKQGFGVYEGELRNLCPWGHGQELQDDGSMYNGDFVDGYRHGFGTSRWGDGIYQGGWDHGEHAGLGRIIFANGKGYEGYFSSTNAPKEQNQEDPRQIDLNKESL